MCNVVSVFPSYFFPRHPNFSHLSCLCLCGYVGWVYTYDEGAKMFEGIHTSEESAMNGTARTLTLFRSSGYKPRINDRVERDNKVFFVKSWYYEDDLLIIRLE